MQHCNRCYRHHGAGEGLSGKQVRHPDHNRRHGLRQARLRAWGNTLQVQLLLQEGNLRLVAAHSPCQGQHPLVEEEGRQHNRHRRLGHTLPSQDPRILAFLACQERKGTWQQGACLASRREAVPSPSHPWRQDHTLHEEEGGPASQGRGGGRTAVAAGGSGAAGAASASAERGRSHPSPYQHHQLQQQGQSHLQKGWAQQQQHCCSPQAQTPWRWG